MKLCPFSLKTTKSLAYSHRWIVSRDLVRTFPIEPQFFSWSAIKQTVLVRFLYSTWSHKMREYTRS